MPVAPQIRAAEQEIDSWIAKRRYWLTPRDLLLERLLNYYRDTIEVFFVKTVHDEVYGPSTPVGLLEEGMRAGVFQALKWTMEFCAGKGRGRADLSPKGLIRLVKFGRIYEVLIDAMTSAQDDAVTIDIDPKKRRLIVHEGPDLTGFDDDLVEHQILANACQSQTSFVEDRDQLTRRWKAGDFRRLARRLASSPQVQGCDKVCLNDGTELFTRPTVLEFPDILDDEVEQRVLEDLTLAPELIAGPSGAKWRLVSMLDVPFVMVGSRRLSTSDVVIAMNGPIGEDHMVRRAVQIDSKQYSKVSGLREARMIDAVRPRLEAQGWRVISHHRLRKPDKEIDVYAVRKAEKLVLQLKSLVRPMTPREVRWRNNDVVCGIDHTAEVLPRLPGAVGFVITNGYRGDYATWAAALRRDVMIGTVDDIEEIAADPLKAVNLLKSRVGFKENPSPARLDRPRHLRLGGWNIEITV